MEDGETLYVRYAVTADRATLVAACKQAGDCSQVPGLKNSVEYHSDDNTDHKKTENSIWVTYKDWSVTKGGTQTTIAKSDPQPGDPNNKKDVSGINGPSTSPTAPTPTFPEPASRTRWATGWKSHPAMWY